MDLAGESDLTIFIPSYNRTELLIKSLYNYIDYIPLSVKLKVLDNHSPVPIIDEIKLHPRIHNRVEIIRNSFNVGLCTNLLLPFYFCDTKFLLIIGDDDDLCLDSVSNILSIINSEQDPKIAAYFFNSQNLENNYIVNDFYGLNKIGRSFGEILWIGGIVYRVDQMKPYLQSGLHYQFLYTPHLIAVFTALDSNLCILFSPSIISINNNHLVDEQKRWSNTKYRLALTYFDIIDLRIENKKIILQKIAKEELNVGLVTQTIVMGYLEDNRGIISEILNRTIRIKLKYDFMLGQILYLYILKFLMWITNQSILKVFNRYYFKTNKSSIIQG